MTARCEEVSVVVLAGGLGTRIRPVLGPVPKVLAPIAGQPFLDHLLRRLNEAGFTDILLSLGQGAEQVLDHLACGFERPPGVRHIVEPSPLGTGGALRFALPELTGDTVMVMNGDSWLEVDFAAALDCHAASGAFATVLAAQVPDTTRYGRLDTDDRDRIRAFQEKGIPGPGAINAGCYLLSREALAEIAALPERSSLETDWLMRQPAGRLSVYLAEGAFIDIGTPESLANADRRYSRPPL